MALHRLVTTAVLTLAAAALPAVAHADSARFRASITLTQEASFDEPRHSAQTDCFHVRWSEGRGQETWTVKARPSTIEVQRLPGGHAFVSYGLQGDLVANLVPGLEARSARSRSATRSSGSDPGPCGGSPDIEPTPLVDGCGSLRFLSRVNLELRGGRVTPQVVPDPSFEGATDFDDCALLWPESADRGFNDVAQDLPLSDLLDPKQRLHVIQGSRSWAQLYPDATAKVTVRWQLRLRRVR